MTVEIRIGWVEGWDALQPMLGAWQDLAQHTGAEVFMSPAWLKAWWPRLGSGRRLVTLTAESDGRLLAILPFMIDRIWLGPIPVKVARLAGTDPNAMILSLPVQKDILPLVMQSACDGLLNRYGARLVSFTPVSDAALYLKELRSLDQPGKGLVLTWQDQGTHSLFDLPSSYEAYLEAMVSNKRRGQIRREIAALETTFGMTSQVHAPSPNAFGDFVLFHNRQWQAQGKGGHFQDWPNSRQVYASLAEGQDSLRLFSLTGKDGPLSTQMCLISGKTCHWRLPARTLDPRADKLSIGKIGLILMIRDLIDMGVTRIEGGRGVYDYKTHHGAQNLPVHRLIVSRDTAVSRLVLRLCLGWSDFLDFAYYRVWFKKLAPRIRKLLRLPARPLWTTWIKSRI